VSLPSGMKGNFDDDGLFRLVEPVHHNGNAVRNLLGNVSENLLADKLRDEETRRLVGQRVWLE
jgi:hypothetical protein